METIRSLDPNRPIDHVQTLEEIRDETIAPQRLNATLIGLFALLALAIATVGVAGVLAFSVSQRTNELGIRLALGAERQAILRMILGEGAAMAAIGLVVGGLAAIPLSRLLSGLLFGVEPVDPPTIAVSAALLVTVALDRRLDPGAHGDGGRSDDGAATINSRARGFAGRGRGSGRVAAEQQPAGGRPAGRGDAERATVRRRVLVDAPLGELVPARLCDPQRGAIQAPIRTTRAAGHDDPVVLNGERVKVVPIVGERCEESTPGFKTFNLP